VLKNYPFEIKVYNQNTNVTAARGAEMYDANNSSIMSCLKNICGQQLTRAVQ
jgi:hypothetical protein